MGYCPPAKRVLGNRRTIEHVVRENGPVQSIASIADALKAKGVPERDIVRWAEQERTRRRLNSGDVRDTRTQRVGVHLEA